MMDDRIKIGKEELFTKEVDEALAKERALKRRVIGEPPPISPIRKVLYSSLFYLPIAAVLGAVAAHAILEPHFNEVQVVGGEVSMVNTSPFIGLPGSIQITVGEADILFLEETKLEKGADGQEPFGSINEIREGDTIEVAGMANPAMGNLIAAAVRPATSEHAEATGSEVKPMSLWAALLFFPLTATLIALGLLIAEGIASRNWGRMVMRSFLGGLLALVFSACSLIVAGIVMWVGNMVVKTDDVASIQEVSPGTLLAHIAFRGAAWAAVGAALGVGMNLVRSSKVQLRNSVLGGALGGALGGTMFDPIDRFFRDSMFADGGTMRLVGVMVLGLSIGIFVALVERLAREAWIRVRTGPLAGKSFILYKTPTIIGSSPQCDVYLFKDAEIDGSHAQIHRVGNAFEIEDMNSRMGTRIGGQTIRRRRLASGDQVVLGGTVLEFEERQKRQS
jgi:hypothetical protein